MTEMRRRPAAAVLLLAAMALAAAARPAAAQAPWKPWGTKPSDKCTPFGRNAEEICLSMSNMSDEQLRKVWAKAHVPGPTDGFPLRGCTQGCIVSNYVLAGVARKPEMTMGWQGKCFSFAPKFNLTSGVPGFVTQIFRPPTPEGEKALGNYRALGSAVWSPTSYTDGKPVFTLSYSVEKELMPYPTFNAQIDLRGVRDEVRMLAPGMTLGRMVVETEPGLATAIPIWFTLFQACGPDGTYTSDPLNARAVGGRVSPPVERFQTGSAKPSSG